MSRFKYRDVEVGSRVLTLICLGVLAVILTAGLWPFHAPKNEVSWLPGHGVALGAHGALMGADMFTAGPNPSGPVCIELGLEPERLDRGGTVLAFYQPASESVAFSIRQFKTGLVLQKGDRDQPEGTNRTYVSSVFRSNIPLLIKINAGEGGAAIYVNGKLVKRSEKFRLIRGDLAGRLIVGNTASTNNSWSGKITKLALYDSELSSAEISHHSNNILKNKPKSPCIYDNAFACYGFEEGKGNVVSNRVDSATNLRIPERFFIAHKLFLERPWDEYHPKWSYWENVGINIAGFIPFGLVFRARFSLVKRVERAPLLTIVVGFLVSLTIESLQSFLPTRESGMTDLFTNTLGTVIGAQLWWLGVRHNWFSRLGLSFDPSQKKVSA